jgi:putative ABC transport system permease protein
MWLYRLLLRLFPASFRDRFGHDMAGLFRDRLTTARATGTRAVFALWARTASDLIRHGLAERRANRISAAVAGRWTRELVQDVGYAFRTLRQRPGFTIAALVTLALGIGANTAIFSAVHAVLLRPLPYPDAHEIVQLYATNRRYQMTHGVGNPFDFDYIERRTTTFASLSTVSPCSTTITGAGDPARLGCAGVMPAFFDVLRTPPAHGGIFTAEQARLKERVVLISHALWTSRFNGRADVLGSTLTLDDQPWTVVGVMPPGFAYPATADLWRPATLTPEERAQRGSWYLGILARLKPGVSIETAQAELDRFAAELAAAYPKQRTDRGFNLVQLQDDLAFRSADGLRLLQGVVIVVLLIACANVANLLLAQTSGRAREIGIRAAVGASRGRLVRQLLTESLVLAVAGACLGAAIAVGGLRLLVSMAPPFLLPDPSSIDVSAAALIFTALVAVATGLVFGLAPAIVASSPRFTSALGAGVRTAAGGLALSRRQWLRAGLVATEVALALVLLAGAGLLVRSFALLLKQPPGLATDRLLTAQLTLPTARYATPESKLGFWNEIVDRLGRLPGVTSAAGSTALPFSLWEWQANFVVSGREHVPNDGAGVRSVTPELFKTLGIPILAGRGFTAADASTSERVAIVSDVFVRQHLGGVEPLGQRISTSRATPAWATIIGVVGSTRHVSLTEDFRSEIYYPLSQHAGPASLLVALKTASDPATYAAALRQAVLELDANLPVIDLQTMDELIGAKLARPRFAMGLLTLFAALAGLLAATGIYGVMSYVVNQSRREIGIRLALGAAAGQVQRRVVRQGLAVVIVGAVAGLVSALWLTGLLESELFVVKPTDAVAFASAAACLFVVAAIACWLPAARVSRVDPAVVLRD